MVDLNDFLDLSLAAQGWVLTFGIDINDLGWITGAAVNSRTQQSRAFLLSISEPPLTVPEPTTLVLLGIGFVGILAVHAKRRQSHSVPSRVEQ